MELDGLTRDSVRALVAPELRTVALPLEGLAWRESGSGDGSRILTGYASVCNQRTTLYSGKYYQLDEMIDEHAFDDVLASSPDVHLNIGHDMNRAIARTGIKGIGGLELSADSHGLRVYARVNPDDPDVAALSAKMDLGIMDQMSFAFRMGATETVTECDEDGRETELLTIRTVAELFDVCVCAQGAYPTTEAALRSLMAAQGEVPAQDQARSQEVSEDADGAADDPQVSRKKQALVLKTRVALNRYPVKE